MFFLVIFFNDKNIFITWILVILLHTVLYFIYDIKINDK